MGQEVKRKRGETFESMMRRFSRRVQQSGKLLQAKKIRFHTPEKSRNLQRASALRREEIKKKRDYLKKIGKLKDEFGDSRNKYQKR
jgi:ribosomal protein S21